MTFGSLRKCIRRLYGGTTPRRIRFRYALLTFDIATVLFVIATSFLPSSEIIEALDVLFGIVSRFRKHGCSSADIGCASLPAFQLGQT